MSLFSLSDINIDIKMQDGVAVDGVKLIEDKAYRRKIKNNSIHTAKAKALDQLCQKPKKNEQWRIVTEKQFNAYALILSVLQETDIEEMCLAIYRINQPTVESIIEFIDAGRIKNATFVISNFFNQTKKPEKWALALKAYADTKNNIKHCYVHNHAKIMAIHTTNDNYYVFEGSGNMSDNARIEQYVYDNNKELFDFHKKWMNELI